MADALASCFGDLRLASGLHGGRGLILGLGLQNLGVLLGDRSLKCNAQ
jgi:hypothetical protein